MKEEERRDQAGERLIFYIQRTSENVRVQSRHQRTSENSQEDIREQLRTTENSQEDIREQLRTTENSQDIRELIVRASK